MCSFSDPEHGLLKPFFDYSQELSLLRAQSYYISWSLWSNFGVTVGLAPAINWEMVLINRVQDRKINTFRHGTGWFKKFVSPYSVLTQSRIFVQSIMILIEIGQSRDSFDVGFYLPPAGFSLMLLLLPRSQSADLGLCSLLRRLRKSIALDNMRNGLRRSEIYKNKHNDHRKRPH